MSYRWRIEIATVEAEFWKLFSSSNPLHLTARLQGTAEGHLELAGTGTSNYRINFDVKVWVHNYEDEDDQVIRIGSFRVTEVPFLVLHGTAGAAANEQPSEAFKVDALADPMREALNRFLNERFTGKPPKELLPDFDIDEWLAKQRQSELRLPPRDEDDDADWWKRGEAPPH